MMSRNSADSLPTAWVTYQEELILAAMIAGLSLSQVWMRIMARSMLMQHPHSRPYLITINGHRIN